jgi:Tol biopolymer transport system component
LVEDNNDNGNIYISNYKDGKWSKIKKLDKTVSSSDWETYASISSDNKTLYFSSDRKGGYGGFDIYKSELTEDGKWAKPINLGSNINTKYDEDTPNITRDGKALYFSSKGHKNMGGFDIFKSEINN